MGLTRLTRKIYVLLLVLIIVFPYSVEAVVQEDGKIEGTVSDEFGDPIEGATVVACCYMKRYTTTTNADGEYTFEDVAYDTAGTKYRVEAYREATDEEKGYEKNTKSTELKSPPDNQKTIDISLTELTESRAKYKELYTLWMEVGDLRAVGEYTIVLFDISKRSWEHAETRMFPEKVYFRVFREGNFIDEYILDLCDNTVIIQEVLKVEMLSIEDRNSDGEYEVELRISSRERPSISLSIFKLYENVAIKEKTVSVNATTTSVEIDGEEFKAEVTGNSFTIDVNKNEILDPYETFTPGDSFSTISGPCISTRSYRIVTISGNTVTLKPEIRELMNPDDFDLNEMQTTTPISGEEFYMYAVVENVGNYDATDVVVSVDHTNYTLLNYCDIASDHIPIGGMGTKEGENKSKVVLLRLRAPTVPYEEYHPITIGANYKMVYTSEEGDVVEEKFQKEFKQDVNVYPKTVQLKIDQFVAFKKLLLGEESDISITVENVGDITAYDLEITSYLPAGLELIEGDATQTIEELSPGDSTQFSYRVKAKELGDYDLITKVRYKDARGEQYEKQSFPVPFTVYKEFPRLELKKNIDKTKILVNEHIIVVLVITNTGNKPAKDIVLVDSIPKSFSLVSSKEEEITGNVNVFKIDRMEPNEKRVFSYVIKADEPGKYTLKGCKVKYADYEDNHFEYEAPDVNIDVSGIPTLDLSYALSRESVQDGELLTVISTVRNKGNGLAENITIDNVFNKGELVNGDLTKEIAALKPGEYQRYKFTVRVPVSSTKYDFVIDATYSYEDILGNTYPKDKKSVQFVQTIAAEKPKIDIARSVEKMIIKSNKYYVDAGYSFIVRISAVNTGSADAVDLVLEESLPSGFEVIDGTNSWEGDLKVGESKTLTYTAIGHVGGAYTLTPRASYKDKWDVSYAATGKSLQFTLRGLDITKNVSKEEVAEGDTLSVTITVRNYGNAEMSDIVIEDAVPEGFEIVEGETTVQKDLLEGGASMRLTYTLKAVSSGEYTMEKARVRWKNPYGESRQLESTTYAVTVQKPTPPPTTTPAPTTTAPPSVVERFGSTLLWILVAVLLLLIGIIGGRAYLRRRSEMEEEEVFGELEISEEELSEEELPEEETPGGELPEGVFFGEEESEEEKTPQELFEELSVPEEEMYEEEEEQESASDVAPDSIKKILDWQDREEKKRRKKKEPKEKDEKKEKQWFDRDYEVTDDMSPREVLKGKKKEKDNDEDT